MEGETECVLHSSQIISYNAEQGRNCGVLLEFIQNGLDLSQDFVISPDPFCRKSFGQGSRVGPFEVP